MCQVGEDDYDISKLWLAQKKMLLALSTEEEHTHEHMGMACVSAWILPHHVQSLALLISAVGMDCPYQIKRHR